MTHRFISFIKALDNGFPVLSASSRTARSIGGIFGNAATIVCIQAVNYLAPLLALPFILRALGPAQFGAYAILFAYGNYVVLFADFSFNVNGPLRVRIATEESTLGTLLANSSALKFLLLLPSCAIFLFAAFYVAHVQWSDSIVAVLLPALTALTPRWMIYSVDKLYRFLLITFAVKVFWLAAVVFLVRTPDNLGTLLKISSASQAVILIACLFSILPNDSSYRPRLTDIVSIFREDLHQFISLISISFLRDSSIIFLSFWSQSKTIAMFSVADRIKVLGLGLVYPLTQSLFLYIARDTVSDIQTRRKIRLISSWFIVGLAALGSLTIFALADKIIFLVAGQDYVQATDILRILCFIPLLTAINSIIGNNVLLAAKKYSQYTGAQYMASIFGLPCAFVLIAMFGVWGAAGAALLSEALLMIFFLRALHRTGLLDTVFGIGHDAIQ